MKSLIVVLALLLLIVHVWFSRQLHDGPNEQILTEAVQPGVSQDGVSLRYDYLDGILEGVVFDQEYFSDCQGLSCMGV